jgi:16S rRNA processing protein RimM
VDRAALPDPQDDEFYHADLVGLEARDSEGRMLGKVLALHNFGASDVIELERPDGDSVHLAFTKETVPVINIADGFLIVAVPEDDEGNDHVE